MQGNEQIERIVRLAALTGYVANARPLSALLCSNQENGKSQLLDKFQRNDGIAVFSDMTGYGLARWLFEEPLSAVDAAVLSKQSGKPLSFWAGKKNYQSGLHHIVITDLNVPLMRRSVVDSYEGFLLKLLWDGIVAIESYNSRYRLPDGPYRCGMLGAVTRDVLLKRRIRRWCQIGLIRRFLPISYEYESKTTDAIFAAVLRLEHLKEPTVSFSGKCKAEIEFPAPLGEYLITTAQEMARAIQRAAKLDEEIMHGFSFLEMLIALCQSAALDAGRRTVNKTDVGEIRSLARWMNYDCNRL